MARAIRTSSCRIVLLASLFQGFAALTYDEALQLAMQGKMNEDIVIAFRENYKQAIDVFGGRPTAMVHAAGNLIPALNDWGIRNSGQKSLKLLEEAVLLGQESLALFPQYRSIKKNLEKAQSNYLRLSRKNNAFPDYQGKLDLDFIEIGTSDYDALASQEGIEKRRGVSVEPVAAYFNKLPVLPNLRRVQAAVVDRYRKGKRSTRMYFVSPELLAVNPDWPEWVRGCVSK
jgi:hypothetical protein